MKESKIIWLEDISLYKRLKIEIKSFFFSLPNKILWFFLNKLNRNTVAELYKKNVNEIYLPNCYNGKYKLGVRDVKRNKFFYISYVPYKTKYNLSEGRIWNYEEF